MFARGSMLVLYFKIVFFDSVLGCWVPPFIFFPFLPLCVPVVICGSENIPSVVLWDRLWSELSSEFAEYFHVTILPEVEGTRGRGRGGVRKRTGYLSLRKSDCLEADDGFGSE